MGALIPLGGEPTVWPVNIKQQPWDITLSDGGAPLHCKTSSERAVRPVNIEQQPWDISLSNCWNSP